MANLIKISENGQKTIARVIGLIMDILFALVAILLYSFSDNWQSDVQVFHIAMEILSMAVIAVVYRLHLGKVRSVEQKNTYFTILCIIIFFSLFFDIISWIIDGSIEYKSLNFFVNACVFIATFIHGAVFFEYIFSCIENKNENVIKLKKTLNYVILIAFIIRIILIVTNTYFHINENGIYETNDIFLFSFFFIPIINLFACGIGAGAGIKLRKLLILLAYPFSTLIMLVIVIININYANSLTAITLSVILIYCSQFSDTEKIKSNLNESFQMYISEGVTNYKLGNIQPGGSTSNSSMLFCNLHHFSDEVEAMEPEDAVVLLNHFYGTMTKIVENNKGRLLEYPGYGLFCIFGEFNDCKNHSDLAIKTAKEMKEEFISINQWNLNNKYPQLKFGIGINSGDVVIGNIGSQNHFRYSAIGKHVNLASRTSTYANDGEIIITKNTLKQSSGIDAELIGSIVPKGIVKPLKIYKLV